MKLQFTASSQRDLIRLRDFIAQNNSPAAARISQQLRLSIQSLLEQPEMGIHVDELPGVRDLILKDYIVRYIVLEQEIYILRVWHGKEERSFTVS